VPGPGDCWTVPVILWRNFETWHTGNVEDVQSFLGACGTDAVITLPMGRGPGLLSYDQLAFPLGNLGLPVFTDLRGEVVVQPPPEGGVLPPAVHEFVRDVDAYAPYAS
jgi:hypothetical protein